jgi:hypothetical protein
MLGNREYKRHRHLTSCTVGNMITSCAIAYRVVPADCAQVRERDNPTRPLSAIGRSLAVRTHDSIKAVRPDTHCLGVVDTNGSISWKTPFHVLHLALVVQIRFSTIFVIARVTRRHSKSLVSTGHALRLDTLPLGHTRGPNVPARCFSQPWRGWYVILAVVRGAEQVRKQKKPKADKRSERNISRSQTRFPCVIALRDICGATREPMIERQTKPTKTGP